MADRIQLKSATTEGLRPSPEYLLPGEICVNLNSKTPGMFFKDSEGRIRKLGPAQYSNNPPSGESIGEVWINPLSADSISVWDGEAWVSAGAVGYVSEVAPTEPKNGQLWYDLSGKELKTWVESESRWVSHRDESTGISSLSEVYVGMGNNPFEIFVDSYSGTDSFTNRGNDPRRPFRTLNRAVIEAAKISIQRGVENDEFDKILIRCRNGNNKVYNGIGSQGVTLGRKWGQTNYQRFIDGANLLLINKDWIVAKSFNALAAAYYSEYTDVEEFREKSPVIKEYLANLVEAVAKDLKANGNSNILRFSKSFYNGDGVLIAFGDDIAVKDLFINVAYPLVVSRSMDALRNNGAKRDDTVTVDTLSENPCSNVQQSASTLLEIFFRTLTGSLSLDIQESVGDNPTEPSQEILEEFNDSTFGGIIIPRGVSIQGADLRKTNIIPSFIPDAGQEENFSMFRFTGGSFFFNFTFKDNPDIKRSHHRLKCFTFATDQQLELFYDKVATAFELDLGDAESRKPETEIVFSEGDIDSTFGSSPYVFNCSIRSEYGMSGIEADGSLVGGLKSFVSAQFTNVSLQKDPLAWEVYNGVDLEWKEAISYQQVVETPIENVRIKNSYRNFAFRVRNGAYAQLVSCFVIGCAVNYWSQSGGDMSITNSTSNFGGTSCLSEGFIGQGTTGGALAQDSDFAVEAIIRPLELQIEEEDQPNAEARRIKVGVFDGYNDSDPAFVDLFLQENFLTSSLAGYELVPGSKIYFVDISGQERIATVDSFPDSSNTNPDDLGRVLRLRAGADTSGWSGNEGREIFIKRFFDFRGSTDRAYKLRVRTTKTGTRRPQINFIFRLMSGGTVGQTQVIRSGAQLDNIISGQRDFVFYVANVEDVAANETETEFDTFDITILGLDSFDEYDEEYLYAKGDIVLFNGKLYQSLQGNNLTNNPDTAKLWWENVKIQQSEERGTPVDAINSVLRQKMDKDDGSVTMGLVRDDYDSKSQNITLKAMDRFLEILGYDADTRDSVLTPQQEANRLFDPTNLPTPSGGAALRSNNFPVEFNRGSLIRAAGQTFEWVGYYNYSKAIPARQNSILTPGNRASALSNEVFGGRVYAIGLTEEGETFQNGKIIPRTSAVDDAPDFDPVDTSIVSRVVNLQVGDCESPEPSQSWLSTDNLKVCQDVLFTSQSVIRNRFALPQGVRSTWGDGSSGTASGVQFGFSRPATIEEAGSGTNTENFLTSFLLKEATKFEIGKVSFFSANTFTSELFRYYLVCDGSLVDKFSYPKLYNFLRGVDYDAEVTEFQNLTSIYGETVSQFRLPDMRGRFLRGWSGAVETRGIQVPENSIDPGRGFASTQEDEFASHNHPLSDPGHTHGTADGPYGFKNEGTAGDGVEAVYTQELNGSKPDVIVSQEQTGITISARGGVETRPHNIALLPVIRFA